MTGALLTAEMVRDRIRAACLEAGSQKAFAAAVGVSRPNLSLVLSGQREPGDAILAALGLSRVVAYSPV
jgi:DNA-binding transcriptional regulator YdaS (Cro superfamily)